MAQKRLSSINSASGKENPHAVDAALAAENEENEAKRLDSYVQAATDTPLERMASGINKDAVSKEQCNAFLESLAKTFGIPEPNAFVAISLLFLKGAVNASAPERMGVDIITEDGSTITITKYDLIYACNQVCKHKYLRRIAEALALPIGSFAEKKGLNGDLAIGLNNNLVAKGEAPLTTKEKAWANSFCQNMPNLEQVAGDRIPSLLAEDFNRRFSKKAAPKSQKKEDSNASRQWRPGNPKKVLKKEGSNHPQTTEERKKN